MAAATGAGRDASKGPYAKGQLVIIAASLLVASGIASLIFQVIWIKQLTLVVGVEVHAVAAVVAAFFAGLGIGSRFWGGIADRLVRPLRLYGMIELGAALLGVGTTSVLAGAAPIFARLEAISAGLAWALPLAAIGLPALLMGGTLPVLVRCLAPSGRDIGEAGGRLYAANTVGAVIGALLPPFILIPWLGIQGTGLAAAGLGAAAGATALVIDRRRPAQARIAPMAEGFAIDGSAIDRDAKVALALYGIAGAIALGYEIVWSQAVLPFMSTRAFAFSIVLATYLLGLTIGAALFARAADRARDAWGTFGALIAGAGLVALLDVALLDVALLDVALLDVAVLGKWLIVAQSGAEAAALALTGNDLAGMSARFAVAAGAVVLAPTILLGAAFPVALRLIMRGAQRGRAVGAAIAVNTLGGILGTILTGFALVPWLGLLRTLGVLAISAAAVGVLAITWGGSRGRVRGAILVLAAGCVAVTVAVRPDRLATLFSATSGSVLAFYEEGRGGTVAVLEQGDGARRFRRLYIQGVSNSGDAMPSLRYMRLQALLPLIIHNGEPRSALVIGYGTGITAGALLRFPDLERRVVAELLPAVIRAAPLFRGTFGAASDGKLDIRLRDGRRELQRSAETYDLVTLEPPPPSAAGVVNLYSRDFYTLAASRLKAHGIVAQWLPLPTQNEDDTRSLVRSFIDVFPYASLWTTELHEMLLVGSLDPVELDLGRIRERYAKPDVAAALAEVGVQSPEALLATYVMGREGLERFAADAPAVTDDRPRIEYASWVRRGDFGSVLPDLLNLRDEVPIRGADAASLAALAARREELLTFYHAGMNALAGNRAGWAADIRSVLAADGANPYDRWFAAP